MIEDARHPALSATELSRRRRDILHQPALPTDPILAAEQIAILDEWFRRRWPLHISPTERVELRFARQIIEDMGAATGARLLRRFVRRRLLDSHDVR